MAIIPVLTPASGLDIFLRYNGVLTDPLSISYQIFEPLGTGVGSGVGFKREVGHYDARNTTIPSGYDITQSWTITWTFTSPAGVTSQASENFTVVDSLSPSFDNVQDIKEQTKLDLGLTTEFTDAQLTVFIQKAINRINRRLELTGTSLELSFDSGTGTITPIPNATILDFLVMQTECLIIKRDRRVAVGKGIRVKDGETEIDTTASFAGFNDAVRDICDELDQAVKDYLAKKDEEKILDVSDAGEIVWYGNSSIRAAMTHNNQGSGRIRSFISPLEIGSYELYVDM